MSSKISSFYFQMHLFDKVLSQFEGPVFKIGCQTISPNLAVVVVQSESMYSFYGTKRVLGKELQYIFLRS